MPFEWDAAKNEINKIKHGISFEEACLIFRGEVLSGVDNRRDYGEPRILSIGAIDRIVVVVVHTDRMGATRIISARLANRRERQKYNEHLGRPA
ncbi:BrnT family toxin [Rhizobium sp. SL42]|uniref:BrnT family toxin n=1 Tax=Rhizobium sp. SL42 TaxID=2806346 RepID=UPI001F21DEF4|nr:BrnT family toxin [Rhizobium sp. SL42]UJW73362.1 BrnT family toxin [Rhizobium sp. SL42]